MFRPIRRVIYLAIPAVALALPASVAAFPLTNCTATLTSYAGDGSVVDTVASGADDATLDDPFEIAADGTVGYEGTSGSIVFGNFSWSVNLFGIPGGIGGSGSNDDGGTTATGEVAVTDVIPVAVVGTFYVTGTVNGGDAGSCEGSGWIQIDGNVFATIQFWVGLLFAGIGLLAMVAAARGRFWTGLIGGILTAVGVDVLLVTFGFLPFGQWTPAIVAAVLIILGPVLGLINRRSPTPAA